MQMLKHAPNLNTIIMVENALKNLGKSVIKVAELKRMLPKQINHITLMTILEYLEESNKIAVSIKGISWIHNEKLRKEIDKGLEL